MTIPPFDTRGLLPLGIHTCTLAEIQSVFCKSDRRVMLFDMFNLFIKNEMPHFPGAGVFVDGSFVRTKPEPDDMDLILDLSSESPIQFERNYFKICAVREPWKARYHMDVYGYHPSLPQDLVSFFQKVGIKAAAELNISSDHPKGILRLL